MHPNPSKSRQPRRQGRGGGQRDAPADTHESPGAAGDSRAGLPAAAEGTKRSTSACEPREQPGLTGRRRS